jgi:hypothetical protein
MATKPRRVPGHESGSFAHSLRAESYLRAAQWLPGGHADVARYEAACEAEGVSLLPATRDFLRRYGGLVIKYEDSLRQTDVLEFCADDAVRGMGIGGLRQVERLLDVRPLCPIGHYQYGTCMLLQDEGGRVFGVSDDTTTFLGESGEEAIENILSLREPGLIRSEVIEQGKTRRQHRENLDIDEHPQ